MRSQKLYEKYVSLDCEVQGHIHAGLRSAPLHNKNYVRNYEKKLRELQEARDLARKEWEVSGEENSEHRKDRMVKAARGHEDLRSTKAAINICIKNGWEY